MESHRSILRRLLPKFQKLKELESGEAYDNLLQEIFNDKGRRLFSPRNTYLSPPSMINSAVGECFLRNTEVDQLRSILVAKTRAESLSDITVAIFGESSIGKTALARQLYEDEKTALDQRLYEDEKTPPDQRLYEDEKTAPDQRLHEDRKTPLARPLYEDRKTALARRLYENRKTALSRQFYEDSKPALSRRFYEDSKTALDGQRYEDRKPALARRRYEDRKAALSQRRYDDRKADLSRRRYEDRDQKYEFEAHVWVDVAGREFRLPSVAREILKSATGTLYRTEDLEELDEMVRDTFQAKTCFIVFDEIEYITRDSWLHMESSWFNTVGFGSKILITTSSEVVVDLVSKQRYKLEPLSNEVGHSDPISEGTMFSKLVPLCRGVPLAIKLLESLIESDRDLEHILISQDFIREYGMFFSDVPVVVLLSIWFLPQQLTQCLCFCALLPQDYPLINTEKLVHLWIANGLVEPYTGSFSAEDTANDYLKQLANKSLFTDIIRTEDDSVKEFRIPSVILKLVRDLARIVCKDMVGVVEAIGVNNFGQLSLALSSPVGKYSPDHLRTLVLSSSVSLGSRLSDSLVAFEKLYSLDLSSSGIQILSDEIRILRDLRYLNLSHTLVEKLPDSITTLVQLRTLNLSGCYHLKNLPKEMRNLTDLIHLDLSLCDSLSHLPLNIGSLEFLNSMPVFVLGKDDECAGLKDLQRLKQLRGRLHIKNLENVKYIEDAPLYQKDIICMGLTWSKASGNHSSTLLESLKPNLKLEVLDLIGYRGYMFPWWISQMSGLIKISIKNCGCEELPSLGQLPLLKELQVEGMDNVYEIGPRFYGSDTNIFPSLEQLGLYCMPKLRKWLGPTTSHGDLFPRLKTLTVEGCPRLRSLPPLSQVPELVLSKIGTYLRSSLRDIASVSTLLIKDTELYLISPLPKIRKLIFFGCKGSHFRLYLHYKEVECLDILHCHDLKDIILNDFYYLQRLYIIDCPSLSNISVLWHPADVLVELVLEDCPRLDFQIDSRYCSLRKLIIKRCGKISIRPIQLRLQKSLEYLWISGCPELEKKLLEDTSNILHIPCVVLGNHKLGWADYV